MEAQASDMTRFDVRLTREQKEFFESVVSLGGFRSLTDFVLSAAQEKAQIILEEHSNWLASKKDREIFFKAIVAPPQANARLKAAAKRYKEATRK